MVLSTKERQARYRATLKARSALLLQTPADFAFAARQVAFYRRERDSCLTTLAKIESGMTFHEGLGAEVLRDVTAEYRADQEARVALFDDLIRVWGHDLRET